MRPVWLATGLTGELGAQLKRHLDLQPLDLSQPVRAQRLIHLAARRPVHTLRQQIESNVIYLRRVLNYAEANEIPEFVFFSSASLYSKCQKSTIAENDVRFGWNDTYSWTKWLGEKMVHQSKVRSRLVVRLSAVLEMHSQTNFISRAFSAIQRGQALTCAHLDRPFNRLISAPEVARFLLHMRQGLAEGTQAVNLVPAANHHLEDLLRGIAETLHKEPIWTGAPSSTRHSVIDNAKLVGEFGFTPQDSLAMIKDWARERELITAAAPRAAL